MNNKNVETQQRKSGLKKMMMKKIKWVHGTKNNFRTNFDTTWKTFSTTASIHGLMQINTQKKWRKIFWIFAFVSSFGLCIWQDTVNFREYFTFDTITSTTIQIANEIGINIYLV